MMTVLLPDSSAADASSRTPVRNGFTLELGLGGGLSIIIPDAGGLDTETEFGMAGLPPTISLGGYFNNELALMFRMTGTNYSREVPGEDEDIMLMNSVGVVVVQYWLNDRFFLSGGAGFSYIGESLFEEDYKVIGEEEGFALDFRTGYSFANWENHSLRVDLEIMPCFYDSATIIGTALLLEWQWF